MTKHQQNYQKTSQIKDYMLKDYQDKKERLNSSLSQETNQSHLSQKNLFGKIFSEGENS
jgi:hypothetical protein